MNVADGRSPEAEEPRPIVGASRFTRTHARIDRVLGVIETVLEAGAQLALVLLMFLTVVNAVARYFFNAPVMGTLDLIVLYVLPALVWLAVPKLQAGNGQIRATFIVDALGHWPRRVADLVATLVMLVLTVAMLDGAWSEFLTRNGTYISGQISMPVGPSWAIVVFGLAGLLLRLLVSVASFFLPREPEVESPGDRPDDPGPGADVGQHRANAESETSHA
ncbi:TRAP-type C4-dicarboxylate transport system permease small subunit [Mycolicibacterium mucogenicum 261Sha1.1M5]|nr:TRAP-type C4-dicarboxylate transport system permease small subunit [Mycolicibacterium mucogenicum 261Sha1.1M5]